jgi:cytokinin dehydrogenase
MEDVASFGQELFEDLRRETGASALLDGASRQAASIDMGRIARGSPRAVVAPRDTAELQRIIQFAGARGVRCTPRGAGYSQGGQSLSMGGLCLDLTRLDRIENLDGAAHTLRCEGGVRLRSIASATLRQGLLPRVLPLNLDMTVGGLLSVGGVGASSQRMGPAVANVLGLDVVTGTGQRVACGPDREAEIFDSILGGLGRCGVIAAATLALRKTDSHVRTFHLAYDALGPWFLDETKLAEQGQATYLEGFVWSGTKEASSNQEATRPSSAGSFELRVGFEYTDQPPAAEVVLSGLSAHRVISVEDRTILSHLERYGPRFETMQRTGAWADAHPWLEYFLPLELVPRALPQILGMLPPAVGDGHRLLLIDGSRVPRFFRVPSRALNACFAILPLGVPCASRDDVLDALRAVDERLLAFGAKRYLSGWLEMTAARWRAHFEGDFESWQNAKRKCDPRNVFDSHLLSASAGDPVP